jgi:hypothetical protein
LVVPARGLVKFVGERALATAGVDAQGREHVVEEGHDVHVVVEGFRRKFDARLPVRRIQDRLGVPLLKVPRFDALQDLAHDEDRAELDEFLVFAFPTCVVLLDEGRLRQGPVLLVNMLEEAR